MVDLGFAYDEDLQNIESKGFLKPIMAYQKEHSIVA